jgi:hypothetical protein
MSSIEARNAPCAVLNDFVCPNAGIGVSGVRRVGSATVDESHGADIEQTMAEVGGLYHIAKWWSGTGGSLGSSYTVTPQSTSWPERGTGNRV